MKENIGVTFQTVSELRDPALLQQLAHEFIHGKFAVDKPDEFVRGLLHNVAYNFDLADSLARAYYSVCDLSPILLARGDATPRALDFWGRRGNHMHVVVAEHPNTHQDTLVVLAGLLPYLPDHYSKLARVLAGRLEDADALRTLSSHTDLRVRRLVVNNQFTPEEVIKDIARKELHPSPRMFRALCRRLTSDPKLCRALKRRRFNTVIVPPGSQRLTSMSCEFRIVTEAADEGGTQIVVSAEGQEVWRFKTIEHSLFVLIHRGPAVGGQPGKLFAGSWHIRADLAFRAARRLPIEGILEVKAL